MSVPSRVKFHITEAGPKKCVAVKACPISSDEAHYDNYLDAARAYEAELEESMGNFESISKPVAIEYEDLQLPQDEDVEQGMLVIKDYFFRGESSYGPKIGELHRDLWFDNQIENVADVSYEDRQQLADLRSQLAKATPKEAEELQAELDAVVANYRVTKVFERYSEFLDEKLQDSDKAGQIAWQLAEPEAKLKVFGRALEQRVTIPAPISREFERIWNSDEFTPGSQRFMEKDLRTTVEKRKNLIQSANQEAYANQLGFPNARQAMYQLDGAMRRIRKYHRTRGRSNPLTVNTVVDNLGLFKD
jgi:hypothetical protein